MEYTVSKEIARYDENGNLIYFKTTSGFESWREYDDQGNEIYYKNSTGAEFWYKIVGHRKRVEITKYEFEQIKRDKEYKEFINREPISKFELMDI